MKNWQFLMLCRHLTVRATMLVVVIVAVSAASRVLPAQDDPSQRFLSPPSGDLPELKQPQEFLKKLRSLIESKQQQQPSDLAEKPELKPSVNPRQVEQLQNALQRLKEQLPPGFVPPDLSAVPPEQLKKALENPAVQQQMRDLLKQFSEDGVLPPVGANNGADPPLPRPPGSNPTPRLRNSDRRRLDRSPDDRQPEKNSDDGDDRSRSVLPPASMKSLQDFLQRLAGDGGPNETPENPSAIESPPRQRRLDNAQQELLDQMTEPRQQSPGPSNTPGVTPRSGPNPSQSDDAETPPKRPPSSQSPVVRPPVPGTTAPNPKSAPSMDIREELQRNGFGDTIKKLVEKAKQESRPPRPAGGDPATPGGTGVAAEGAGSGLEQSMIRMLDGMKDDLVEIAKEGNFREPTRRAEPRRQNPARSPDLPQSESALSRMRKAASELFAGPARPPRRMTSSGGSSSGISPPALDIQFDLTPVAVLAGILVASAAGFFGLRFLKQHSANAKNVRATANPLAPNEIQNREDVIRAFHEFAMRSTRSVQSWWTHRAVERVIITASPEKQSAVETLANAYEMARYLPQEVHFSSEQIQSARKALQQCATGAEV